nr:PREDICTED: protein phosphatase 1 regulatory subunit 15A [Lepisosteus oculatus]
MGDPDGGRISGKGPCTLGPKDVRPMKQKSEAVPTVLGKRPTQDWQAGHEDGLRERDISDWLEWDSEEELEAERDLKGEDPGSMTGSCSQGILDTVPKSSFSSPGECWVSHRILSRVSSLSPSEGVEDEDDAEWSDEEEEEEEDEDESGMSDEMPEATAELWESFLRSDDPYNPFAFLGPCGKEKKRKSEEGEETGEAEPPGSWKGEDSGLKNVQKGKDCCRLQEGKIEGKKVRFSDTVVVRPLVVWAFASRAARSGACWQEMARDRDRFQRRVQQTSVAIEPCLQPEHRARVWERLHAMSSGL